MMNRILTVACALALSSGAASAQQTDAPKAAKGNETTLTGCLNKGADQPQHYAFTEQKTGRKLTVTGPADLEKHSSNHTVRLIGSETAVFNVTKVEHVAATCDAGSSGTRGAGAGSGTGAGTGGSTGTGTGSGTGSGSGADRKSGSGTGSSAGSGADTKSGTTSGTTK
jgi:hypothetical protein